jgi:transcriptional regulator with XRE-family HTH domain
MSRHEVAHAFGHVLRARRNSAGLSQEELAFRADVDRTYPSLLERGLRTPTLTVLFGLGDALKVNAAELVQQTADQLERTP